MRSDQLLINEQIKDAVNAVLNKIRAEIEACREEEEPHLCDHRHYRNEGIDKALEIIDKYREEQTDAT